MAAASAGSSEWWIGEIGNAYAVGIVRGPVRLEFTDRRLVVFRTLSPGPARVFQGYRVWRDSITGGPVCRTMRSRFEPGAETPQAELAHAQIASVRVDPTRGLWVDRTVCTLMVSNIRGGWTFGRGAAARPGVPENSPDARPPMIFRIPASVSAVTGLLRLTPLADRLPRSRRSSG